MINISTPRTFDTCVDTVAWVLYYVLLIGFVQVFPSNGDRPAVTVRVYRNDTCETVCAVIAAKLDIMEARVLLRDTKAGRYNGITSLTRPWMLVACDVRSSRMVTELQPSLSIALCLSISRKSDRSPDLVFRALLPT